MNKSMLKDIIDEIVNTPPLVEVGASVALGNRLLFRLLLFNLSSPKVA